MICDVSVHPIIVIVIVIIIVVVVVVVFHSYRIFFYVITAELYNHLNIVLFADTTGSSIWSTEDNHVGFGGLQAKAFIWCTDTSM